MFCKCAAVIGPTGFGAGVANCVEAIVLPVPDIRNVQDAVETLINDDELRERLGKAGHARTKGLRWENYRAQLRVILECVVEDKIKPNAIKLKPKTKVDLFF
jgi:glycosyltransferase involved in cell wall biosynthesis